jgi:hypothetical protein
MRRRQYYRWMALAERDRHEHATPLRESRQDDGATKEEAHHRKLSFAEEFLALLRKHGVAFDPKFVFG